MQALEDAARSTPHFATQPFMNWQQVREMAQAGIEFGNHTVSHPELPRLPDDAVETQISAASLSINEHLGSRPACFAYPYGKYDDRIRGLAVRQGFRAACTTRIGHVRIGDDAYLLNRINIASDVARNEALFAGHLLGL
jgi:peptidoglycan/xylan/chitin deacetylase (PgdA/CDA1 family)